MRLPEPDPAILARRPAIIAALEAAAPGAVIADPASLVTYDSDALAVLRQTPLAVVLPRSAEEVSAVLRTCADLGVKIVPRGAGTSLSGGALPLADSVVVGTARMNRILEVDLANACVVCEPGVTNLAITRAVEGQGFFYAPDPSSQVACTIGGNVAENAGGIHCLKYGLTTNNLLGLELALLTGERVRLGGKHLEPGGYDLLGLATGSEGLLGIVTEVTVRVLHKPEAVQAMVAAFPDITSAAHAVAAIIGAGIVPAAMELMDAAAVRAVEAYCAPGYPSGAGAVLLIELDGPPADVAALSAQVRSLLADQNAMEVTASTSEAERQRLWAGRKAAFPAAGRLAKDMLCMDGTIPRKALASVLAQTSDLARSYGLGLANVFHAGDGNLHPLILFDAMKDDELARAEALGADILKLCVSVGGVLTGEHGVGVEKRDLMGLMFSEVDLAQQTRLKCVFDPSGLLNPGKVFPALSACVEGGRLHVHEGRVPFPNLERL